MWFYIGVEVEQGTSAPPPKKNPGSAPDMYQQPEIFRDSPTQQCSPLVISYTRVDLLPFHL